MPEIAPPVTSASISIDGSPLGADVMDRMVSASVETGINLPGRFSATFRDEDTDLISTTGAEAAGAVSIHVTSAQWEAPVAIFSGEITAIETDFSYQGTRTTIRGYETCHRLQAGNKARTFVNSTYSDIFRKVCSEASVNVGSVSTSRPVHRWVAQNDVSNWELIQAMADELGYLVTTDEAGKLSFSTPSPSGEPLEMMRGKNLIRARIGLSGSQQVPSVTVNTWDEQSKQVQLGNYTASTSGPVTGWGPATLAGSLGSPGRAEMVLAQMDQESAQGLATSIGQLIGETVGEIEALGFGEPQLRAGGQVKMSGFGTSFDGTYRVSSVRHEFDWDGFRTSFTCSGRHDRSLLGLTRGNKGAEGFQAAGVAIGIVTDNDDNEKALNRVKVKIPALDDTFVTDWVPVVQAGAGENRGAVFLPEVNDQVLVAFEQDDIRRPVVIGGMHNGTDKPMINGEELVKSGKVLQRAIVSSTGHTFALVDEQGKEKISLTTGDNDYTLVLDQGQKQITVTSSGKVTISGTDEVTISGKQNVTVKADSNVTLQGKAGVKISTDGPLELQGATVKISSNGPLEATGTPIKLN